MDIDPECNYCPTCHDEYRPEISTCAACGVALESGAALRARLDRQRPVRPEPIGADEPLALVRRGPLGQIRQLQALLEAHGLAADAFVPTARLAAAPPAAARNCSRCAPRTWPRFSPCSTRSTGAPPCSTRRLRHQPGGRGVRCRPERGHLPGLRLPFPHQFVHLFRLRPQLRLRPRSRSRRLTEAHRPAGIFLSAALPP